MATKNLLFIALGASCLVALPTFVSADSTRTASKVKPVLYELLDLENDELEEYTPPPMFNEGMQEIPAEEENLSLMGEIEQFSVKHNSIHNAKIPAPEPKPNPALKTANAVQNVVSDDAPIKQTYANKKAIANTHVNYARNIPFPKPRPNRVKVSEDYIALLKQQSQNPTEYVSASAPLDQKIRDTNMEDILKHIDPDAFKDYAKHKNTVLKKIKPSNRVHEKNIHLASMNTRAQAEPNFTKRVYSENIHKPNILSSRDTHTPSAGILSIPSEMISDIYTALNNKDKTYAEILVGVPYKGRKKDAKRTAYQNAIAIKGFLARHHIAEDRLKIRIVDTLPNTHNVDYKIRSSWL